MTQDIIAMAREAGLRVGPSRDGPDDVWGVGANLERFAALVRADERDRATRENAYVLAEREACADIAENWNCNGAPRAGVAAQIRARGNT
jgi:hypothetical protein